MNRYEWHYHQVVRRDLQRKLGHTPVLKRITLQVSLKKTDFDTKTYLFPVWTSLELIRGQKPQINYCRKPLAMYRILPGQERGISVNLRGSRIYYFWDFLINGLMPRLRPFHGISWKSLDKTGNLCYTIPTISRFPFIETEHRHLLRGRKKLPLEVHIHNTCRNVDEGIMFLTAMQFPLKGKEFS